MRRILSSKAKNNTDIEVFNVYGEKVITNWDAIPTHVNQFSLDTKNLKDGIYQIRISTGDKTIHLQKILIIN